MHLIRTVAWMSFFAIAVTLASSQRASAQATTVTAPPAKAPTMPYGTPITLEQAQKALVAAKEEADKQGWPVAIAVVDPSGYLVAFHRLDNTQLGSVEVSIEKAKTSALFRRPTKAFEDMIAQGGAGLRILKLPGATPLDGGLPIVHDGKIIGGIGVSGVTSTQDAQVATAGLTPFTAGAKN